VVDAELLRRSASGYFASAAFPRSTCIRPRAELGSGIRMSPAPATPLSRDEVARRYVHFFQVTALRGLKPPRNAAVTNSLLRGGSALMRLGVMATAVSLCLVGICSAQNAHAAIRKDLIVPAEDLSPALQQVATTYELQVLYPTQVAKDLKTHGAAGTFTADDALKAVLSGTGLSYKYLDASTVTVFAATAPTEAAAGGQDRANTTQDNSKEAGKNSSQEFRVAQVDQGKTTSDSSVERQNEEVSKKKFVLQEVVVTGSRLALTASQSAQDVKTYTSEQIAQSGQTTVSDFLNTLPSVSIAVGENYFQTGLGSTTVQLRGLPYGTTLVLINGRRIETSGSQSGNDFFDLNNIPLAAVERIEVVADGSSAIYGSDAIAGVVNIILKRNFDGFEASAKYGWASSIDETNASAAWGKRLDKGSFSIIGSYQTRGELDSGKRSITANNNYQSLGGTDNNLNMCNPGNIFSADGVTPLPGLGSATYAAVPVGYTGKPSVQEFQGTAGTLNECSIGLGATIIAPTHRAGVYAQGSYQLTPKLELFTELMYSHVEEFTYLGYQGLFGQPGFQSFTASAANPYNPFGTTVGVAELFTTLPRLGENTVTDFFRPLVGARGSFVGSWDWEVSAWSSEDRTRNTGPLQILDTTAIQNALNSPDPAQALNPFVAGPPGSYSLLRSFFSDTLTYFKGREQAINGFVRGQVLELPSGPIALVFGSEYNRDLLSSDVVSGFGPPNTQATYQRNSAAVFGEARIPIWANHSNPQAGDTIAATVAGRYDHFSDFGSITTPQFSAEWRPAETLLFRATYAEAFKAPPLLDLYAPQTVRQQTVTDPLTGQIDFVTATRGGNANLSAETGRSHTVGLVYSSDAIRNLRVSVTNWEVRENKAIQPVNAQFIVDNENLYSGRVLRGPPGPNGQPGPITSVNATFINFGSIEVAGLDFQIDYHYQTHFGTLSSSVAATNTYRYREALVPGAAPIDAASNAQDSGDWAPRWKGAVKIGWTRGPFSANLDGRYVGRYQDYDSTRQIGNFWLFDGNLRYDVEKNFEATRRWTRGAYIEFGGVNLFNKLPQFSNYNFGTFGYDPAQADIRGRFLYVELGKRL